MQVEDVGGMKQKGKKKKTDKDDKKGGGEARWKEGRKEIRN